MLLPRDDARGLPLDCHIVSHSAPERRFSREKHALIYYSANTAICINPQERHQTAVMSAERLREKLDPASSGPCDQPTDTDGIHIPLTHEAALDALVRVARGEASDAANGQDHAADLRRDADSLKMKQWIDNVRAEACDRAEGTAREACEDIWRETAPVATMEGELNCFAKDLDSLLLRLERAEDEEEEEGEEGEEEEDGPDDVIVPLDPRGGVRAPAADAHVEYAQ